MKTSFLSLILIFSYIISNYGQSKVTEYKKMIIGKWEYNVAYDTIAVADDGKNETDNFFFTNMKITKDKIKISDMYQDWKGKWEIKNNNEFHILLDNKKILKYFITLLNNKSIELQSFGIVIPTLGYKRK